MNIVERDAPMVALDAALDGARAGSGSVVFVSGEAGVGKTTLIRAFLQTRAARTLWSACDDLATASPLGPIRDLARQSHGDLARVLDSQDQAATFEAVLNELHVRPGPSVLVFEDVHWMDEASADVVTFVGRRIERAPGLMILTGRDDELGPDHPARLALAGVPPHSLKRVELAALTPSGIAELGGLEEQEARRVHQLTGGNPFFVAEVLAAGGDRVPASVVDAVLARGRQLDETAIRVLELISCVPSRTDRDLIQLAMPGSTDALAACEAAGLLEVDQDFARFRHELARRAVESTLTQAKREELNGRVLAALESLDADPARLVHHAQAASDAGAIARWAPVAGEQASSVQSHTEAAQHFDRAVALIDRFDPDQAADLEEAAAAEHYIIGNHRKALDLARSVVDRRRDQNDPVALASSLVFASRAHWHLGERQMAEAAGEEAISLLEPLGPSPLLARAYSNRTQLAMLWGDADATERWGDVAISMAREVGDAQVLGHALNNVGSQRAWKSLAEEGLEMVEEARAIAEANGFDEDLCRAYTNIAWELFLGRKMQAALEAAAEGLAVSIATQQTSFEFYLRASMSLFGIFSGDLRQAEEDAAAVIEAADVAGISVIPASAALGAVRSRQGRFDEAKSVLVSAWPLAEGSQEIQRTSPVALAMAELAWLEGNDEGVIESLDRIDWSPFDGHRGHLYDEAAMTLWYRRVGVDRSMARQWPPLLAPAVAGDHRQSATLLDEAGVHYTAAEMLMDSPNPADVQEAVERFESMNAPAAARRAAERLARLAEVTRKLSTVMFTDIVDSTVRASEVGDAQWRVILDRHDAVSRSVVAANGGRVVKLTGDGTLATFDTPSAAIRAAVELRSRMSDEQVEIRAAVHTGEVEIRGDDIGGLAVHIAARLMGVGDGVVVSSTTKDLSAGSPFTFTDLGEHELRGVDGIWHAYRVDERE